MLTRQSEIRLFDNLVEVYHIWCTSRRLDPVLDLHESFPQTKQQQFLDEVFKSFEKIYESFSTPKRKQ